MIARELAETGIAFLAWLLAVSALHKLLHPARGAGALRAIIGLSAATSRSVIMAAASIEAVAALLACFAPLQWLGALLATGLYGAYALLLRRAVAAGRRELDCGCTLSATKQPMGNRLGTSQIAKAAALSALACGCAAALLFHRAAPSFSAALAGLAGFALYFAAEQLDGLPPLRSGEQA